MRRARHLLGRLLGAVATVWFGATAAFLALYAGPLSLLKAVTGGRILAPGERAAVRTELGLAGAGGRPLPLWEQYLGFLRRAATADFGQSLVVQQGTGVGALVWSRAATTAWVALWALVLAVAGGTALGYWSGRHARSPWRLPASAAATLARSTPAMWLAVLVGNAAAIAGLAERSGQATGPVVALDAPPELGALLGRAGPVPVPAPGNLAVAVAWVLPAALVVAAAPLARIARVGRDRVARHHRSGYADAARAKGLSPRVVRWKHVGPNAVLPAALSVLGQVSLLSCGLVLAEVVLGVDGLGVLFLDAALAVDVPVLAALWILALVGVAALGLARAGLRAAVDPRPPGERAAATA